MKDSCGIHLSLLDARGNNSHNVLLQRELIVRIQLMIVRFIEILGAVLDAVHVEKESSVF